MSKEHRWINCHIFSRPDDKSNFISIPTKTMDYWEAKNFAKTKGKTVYHGTYHRSSKDPEILREDY